MWAKKTRATVRAGWKLDRPLGAAMRLAVILLTGIVLGCSSEDPDAASSRADAAKPSEDAAQVTEVAYSYFRPAKAGDGGRACAQLTPEEHARLDRAGGCADVVNAFGRRFPRGREAVVTGVRVNARDGTARATVNRSSIRGRPPVIHFWRVQGCWRIADTRLARRP